MHDTDTLVPAEDFRNSLVILELMLERKTNQVKSLELARDTIIYALQIAQTEYSDTAKMIETVKARIKVLNECDKTYN